MRPCTEIPGSPLTPPRPRVATPVLATKGRPGSNGIVTFLILSLSLKSMEKQ